MARLHVLSTTSDVYHDGKSERAEENFETLPIIRDCSRRTRMHLGTLLLLLLLLLLYLPPPFRPSGSAMADLNGIHFPFL